MKLKNCQFSVISATNIALTAVTITTNKATNDGSGRVLWPHMLRMRARGGEENEAYGPLESVGEIDSVNPTFLYFVMQVF